MFIISTEHHLVVLDELIMGVTHTSPQSGHVIVATKTVPFDTYGGLLVFLEI